MAQAKNGLVMREPTNLPEGRAPREPLDLLRERERAQRLTTTVGGIGVLLIAIPFFRRQWGAQIELEREKLERKVSRTEVARSQFGPKYFLNLALLILLITLANGRGRTYAYRLLVRACVRADKRYSRLKALRRLFFVSSGYEWSVQNLDFQGINLSEMYLHEANLAGANLSRADLSSTYLRRADLSQANLDQAILTNAIVRGAALVKTSARQMMANGASFVNADLSEAILEGANLEDAILDGAIIES